MRKMFSEKQIKELTKNFIESGNLAVNGKITGNEIVENMSGYSFAKASETANITREFVYAGIVKNGNKLTLVVALNITRTDTFSASNVKLGEFTLPSDVYDKLYPTQIGGYNFLDVKVISVFKSHYSKVDLFGYIQKGSNPITIMIDSTNVSSLELNTKYYVRYECTFLLSDNLAE